MLQGGAATSAVSKRRADHLDGPDTAAPLSMPLAMFAASRLRVVGLTGLDEQPAALCLGWTFPCGFPHHS